jgi:biopolymer transport protein ExbD
VKTLIKKHETLTMDLTPIIDVVFLLLIFFIVASEFKKNETILNLTLPNSSSLEKVVKNKAIIIEISVDKIAYKATELDFIMLKEKLSLLKKDTSLTVKIDKDVKYKKIVKLLDILNTLKLNNILLITKT